MLPRDWNHRTLLALGLWYVLNPPKDGPIEAVRRGIIACEARLDGSQAHPGVYREAITAFDLKRIEAFAISAPPSLGLIELANALVTSELANRDLPLAA